MNELTQLKTDFLNLQKENRAMDEAAKTAEFVQQRIEETIKERDKLQREFDTLTKQPFFVRETNQESFKRISDLEAKIKDRDKQVRESKANIIQNEEKIRKLIDE